MSYQSPVEIITSQMQTKIEGEVYSAVQRVGIDVDKDELLKALQYDCGQYEKGYKDRDNEIIRCKDCKHGEKVQTFKYYPDVTWCNKYSTSHNDNWFCADGGKEIK